MKKNLLVSISLAAMTVAGLASCGGQDDGKIKVVFWHTMGQNNQAWLNERIEEFNKIYPEVRIEHLAQGGYDDIKDKLSKAIPAGTTPTMAYCYPDHVADYLIAGAVQDMTPYIESTEYGLGVKEKTEDGKELDLGDLGQSDFIEGYWEEGIHYVDDEGAAVNGVYSLPFSKSTEVMFYNKTAFDENGWSVPTTWAEMWTWAAAAKAKYPDCTPLGYDSDANMLITLFEQNMIPYTSATTDDTHGHYLFNNKDAKDVVSDLASYYKKGYFVTAGTSSNNSYTSNMFVKGAVSGGCLISIGSTGGTGYNWPANKDADGKEIDHGGSAFEVGVAAIPQADPSNKKVIMQGPSVTFFKRSSEEQKKYSWLFYKYLTNTDNSASYSFLTGYQPVRQSSYESDYYDMYDERTMSGTKYQLIHEVTQFIPNIKNDYYASPAFHGSSAARKEMDALLANVCNKGTSVDDAFRNALTNCVFAGE